MYLDSARQDDGCHQSNWIWVVFRLVGIGRVVSEVERCILLRLVFYDTIFLKPSLSSFFLHFSRNSFVRTLGVLPVCSLRKSSDLTTDLVKMGGNLFDRN